MTRSFSELIDQIYQRQEVHAQAALPAEVSGSQGLS
jgi:hypothetical protein